MTIEAMMTTKPRSCRADQSLAEAAAAMWEADVGCLPVIEEGKPIAMITDRDICMAAYIQGVRLCDSQVSTAMSKRLISVPPNARIGEVETLMRENQIRRVPVVDEFGMLVGIVTLGDIARHAREATLKKPLESVAVASTLAEIVERRPVASVSH